MRYESALPHVFAALVLCVAAGWPAVSSHAAVETTQATAAATETLDVDGNGVVDALTDGLLVIRYTFGVRGQALIQGTIGANATRTTAAQIESYLSTLTASLPNPANCSIASVPTSSIAGPLAPGTQVQLTASCARGEAPISYAWNTGPTTPTLSVSPQSTTTYTVTPSNIHGLGVAISATVHIGVITAPSSCSISQSPDTNVSAVSAGTTVNLSVGCSGGSAPTACSWSNGIASTSCSINVTAPSVTTTYFATASNASGSSPSVSTTVNVIVPGQTSQNFCTGTDEILITTWPASGQIRLFTNGFKNQRLAWKIVVPYSFSPPLNIDHLGFLRIAEKSGFTVTSRDFTVSRHSCDFQSGNYLINGIGTGDTSPYVSFTANNPNGYAAAGASMNINSGDTVYLNVRNQLNGGTTCPYPACDILMDFATPNRY